MSNASRIPVIDLSPARLGGRNEREAVAREIDAACRDLGFLVVSGHGVPDALVRKLRHEAFRFFALPDEKKCEIQMRPGAYRGYMPHAKETLSLSLDNPSPPDLKEYFNIGPISVGSSAYYTDTEGTTYFAANRWPEGQPELRSALEAYYLEMECLAAEMMRLFAIGLELPENFFDDKVDRHITNMSLLYYPALSVPPLPGQLRAGAHSDYGSITILQRDETAGGLEVMSSDQWIGVPDIPGSFVINLGDLMQDWTGGAWRSTLHRVVNPPTIGTAARLSMAFFHQPNWDAMISPLAVKGAGPTDFKPVMSGAHNRAKLAKATGALESKVA
jgi:isopenicillin N synthase-like dioxygenase